jgi:hypothetical protein
MTALNKAEYDALYTFLEDVLPTLSDPQQIRDAQYFMDRCEGISGPLRDHGKKLNTNRFSGFLGDLSKGVSNG